MAWLRSVPPTEGRLKEEGVLFEPLIDLVGDSDGSDVGRRNDVFVVDVVAAEEEFFGGLIGDSEEFGGGVEAESCAAIFAGRDVGQGAMIELALIGVEHEAEALFTEEGSSVATGTSGVTARGRDIFFEGAVSLSDGVFYGILVGARDFVEKTEGVIDVVFVSESGPLCEVEVGNLFWGEGAEIVGELDEFLALIAGVLDGVLMCGVETAVKVHGRGFLMWKRGGCEVRA
jgi:hypothetical protein